MIGFYCPLKLYIKEIKNMNEMAEGHPNYEHKTEINEQENAIQILKETAEKFRLLYAEDRLALAGKDVEEYKTKLKERA